MIRFYIPYEYIYIKKEDYYILKNYNTCNNTIIQY